MEAITSSYRQMFSLSSVLTSSPKQTTTIPWFDCEAVQEEQRAVECGEIQPLPL